ncbi:MAG: hypothetical protein ACD_60C00027G0008 [uncultured bacterium]|nr:MAG: hypothetical protein ACD_60C00027G0008 [uncultured bacterium]
MLFNSYFFIFLFLPVTLLLFFFAAKWNRQWALSVLLIASFIFYSWYNYHYGIILFFSIGVNFFISKNIIKISAAKIKKYFLHLGLIFNLGLLGYFKYMNFFIQNINSLIHHQINLFNITLPLGISFFTFTQIAFLVDSYRGLVQEYKFLNYALFVSYFPHLIAGPIIHHMEVMPQFEKSTIFKVNHRNLLVGLTIFAIGLFKKVIIADYLARLVTPVFDIHSSFISTTDAWIGALAYTFELYFDFSGYSDMAVGLSLLLGIKLPINFYSPYKSANIIEFWRRWNMTLSRFLRNYLYIPLGGNRKGPVRRYINLMITMILGGLWHGASWTFITWGCLHGLYLCINHGWISLKKVLKISNHGGYIVHHTSKLITFVAIVIAWVFFRAPDFTVAFQILHAMFLNIFTDPFSWCFLNALRFFSVEKIFTVIAISFVMIGFLPNTYQLLSRIKVALSIPKESYYLSILVWKPNFLWDVIISIIFVIDILCIQSSSTFLYFQF